MSLRDTLPGGKSHTTRLPERADTGGLPAPIVAVAIFATLFLSHAGRAARVDPHNLVVDESFEETSPADQFGHVFRKWGGWKYEGDCEFRVGQIAHSGKSSCLLFGVSAPKIRISQTLKSIEPGRYRVTAFLRGLDVGEGVWHMSSEFLFDGKYISLKKNGTFGWTPMTYVADVKQKKDAEVGFGMWAPGYFWIDDVSVVPVGSDVPLTPEPVLGREERPVQPPELLVASNAIHCPECGFRNLPAWGHCYACGAALTAAHSEPAGPPVRTLTDFSSKNPFDGGTVGAEHAAEGGKSLRLEKGYAVWAGAQNWTGYDYLKADLYTESNKPVPLFLEMADQQTRDYWTRVNYETLVAPGRSTLIIPLQQLYVGEKARPGRNLLLGNITRLVLSVGDKPQAPLYVSNLRLERDTETQAMRFDGLQAFSLGPTSGPLMPGFTRIDPSTLYSKGRGYGLKDALVWRAFDARQPEPLYQNFICIEKGGLAVDLPNGRYHVFVNIDNPGGFWGEYQTYKSRSILAQGQSVVSESMTFDSFQKNHFRNWDTEDLPTEDTFTKYQLPAYHEKQFDVDVTNGQLDLDFRGEAFACSVSAVIIYPEEKSAEGKKFLDFVVRRRQFFFDNYFHRILHKPTGDALAPTADDENRGFVSFTRDEVEDVFYNDTPRKEEIGKPARGFAFAGQSEPLTVSIVPLSDLGNVTVSMSDLIGAGTITSKNVSLGYVSYRVTRVSSDGAVYTIAPRLVVPRNTVDAPRGMTRRFWLTVNVPADAKPGLYRGHVTFASAKGRASEVPVEIQVYPGTLDPADIPVGPFSHTIDTQWDGSDPLAQNWNRTMEERCLRKLHDCGFTTFTGLPLVRYLGFKEAKPQFDFTEADRQMELARRCGFTMPVVSYIGMPGLNLYNKDETAMKAAGFNDYPQFLKALFTAIQAHADASDWLPVYWNIGDEPVGEEVIRSAENAEAYRAAVASGPPWFTAPTSFESDDANDPHFRFAKALHAVALNGHSETAIRMIQKAGSNWGFYNGGNRWTYGCYLYKAAKQFDAKFRISWHWNATAGDPYYALDCREDDYAWCNANADGELIPSVEFEREYRGGLNDYRYLITLARLAREKHDAAAQELIDARMATFKLGQREHDAIFAVSDYREFRQKVADAIARLRTTN